MLHCLTSEREPVTQSEDREQKPMEDPKDIITLAFVRENTGVSNGPRNAQHQGKKKKKRKKKRLGLEEKRGSVPARTGGGWSKQDLGRQSESQGR